MEEAPLKPFLYKCFVDDNLLIWQYGQEELDNFVQYLNNWKSIQFTKKQEKEGKLPFLDIQIIRHADGSLGRTVYRKQLTLIFIYTKKAITIKLKREA